LEDCLIPDEDDPETWDPSGCDELAEEMAKITQILNHENGLKAKLDCWENYREIEEEVEDD
jgi:ABC-type transport system involved in cytochrome c biogenesis ATPase subunit